MNTYHLVSFKIRKLWIFKFEYYKNLRERKYDVGKIPFPIVVSNGP